MSVSQSGAGVSVGVCGVGQRARSELEAEEKCTYPETERQVRVASGEKTGEIGRGWFVGGQWRRRTLTVEVKKTHSVARGDVARV